MGIIGRLGCCISHGRSSSSRGSLYRNRGLRHFTAALGRQEARGDRRILRRLRGSVVVTKRSVEIFSAAVAGASASFFLFLLSYSSAAAVSSDCERLRRAIADSSRSSQGAQYEAAAERQRAEIDRTIAYAQQIGCNNRKVLFFGSDPPAQCDQIHGQIGRMRANLEDLQSKAGGGPGGRGELIARYNAQCTNQAARSPSIVDALFGQPKPGDLQEQPLTPDGIDPDKLVEKPTDPTVEARAGGKAVCVRSCDGAFFPLSYSASGGSLDSLAEMCRALCPNAEVTLYTYPVSGDIEQAVSINGARYMDGPTALRYRRVFDFVVFLSPSRADLGERISPCRSPSRKRSQIRHHRDTRKGGGAVASKGRTLGRMPSLKRAREVKQLRTQLRRLPLARRPPHCRRRSQAKPTRERPTLTAST